MNFSALTNIPFARNIDAPSLFEAFFVSAISSILFIRLFLNLTGYPQLGDGGLHIAHMLWGGLFMLLGIMLFISFLNKSVASIAAVLSGIGFGTFIDELGKFITSDNNYFFQPTIALIYSLFVLLFISFRTTFRKERLSEAEYITNSLDYIKESILNDLDNEEKIKALEILKNVKTSDPLVPTIKDVINKEPTTKRRSNNAIVYVKNIINAFYEKISPKNYFLPLLVALLIAQSFSTLLWTVDIKEIFINLATQNFDNISFGQLSEIIFSIISGFFAFWGLAIYKRSKINAFRNFRISLLITILLTQVFAFYDALFWALIPLTLNILLLSAVEYIKEREEALARAERLG